jgi:diguanylate cyclase (GGDEF)-like protein/PAS domain S-box-containing protein
MNTDHLNYAVILFLSGCIALFYILLIRPRRKAPGVFALMIFMGGVLIWTWTYCLHWLFPDWPANGFWLDATYIGVVIAPTAMLVFVLQLNYLDEWISKKTLALLGVEPVLTLAILWTDPFHGLFFAGKRTPVTTDIYEGGFWFWLNIVYIYIIILISLFVIVRGFLQTKGIYRQQQGLILVGACIPVIANLLRFFGFEPFPGLDLTPIVFSFQGMFYTIGVLSFSTFDLIPVAREALLETMPEWLLVVDNRWRLVEINHSALELLGEEHATVLGTSISYVLRNWLELEKTIKRADRIPTSYQVQFREDRSMGINITPLFNKEGYITGRLVTGQDITRQLQTEARLEEANQQLRAQLREIQALQETLKQQVIRDPLTGLLNRRVFQEELQIAVARANRKEQPITILIIDIDKFKRVNDTYGHAAGDLVLENLGKLLHQQTRKYDLAARLGGEEFLILMNEMNLETGLKRAEEIRGLIEIMDSEFENISIHITVSIGAAEYPSSSDSIQDVMRKADQALYRAKYKGRNQVAR